MRTRMVNGVTVDFTPEEETAKDIEKAADEAQRAIDATADKRQRLIDEEKRLAIEAIIAPEIAAIEAMNEAALDAALAAKGL